jgi:hypothetical protein
LTVHAVQQQHYENKNTTREEVSEKTCAPCNALTVRGTNGAQLNYKERNRTGSTCSKFTGSCGPTRLLSEIEPRLYETDQLRPGLPQTDRFTPINFPNDLTPEKTNHGRESSYRKVRTNCNKIILCTSKNAPIRPSTGTGISLKAGHSEV